MMVDRGGWTSAVLFEVNSIEQPLVDSFDFLSRSVGQVTEDYAPDIASQVDKLIHFVMGEYGDFDIGRGDRRCRIRRGS